MEPIFSGRQPILITPIWSGFIITGKEVDVLKVLPVKDTESMVIGTSL
jgi:hypothetical protein